MANVEQHPVRYSAEELKNMVARGEDWTEWARVGGQSEDELESSIDRLEEGEADWLHAKVGIPSPKQQLTVRFDLDVVEWFRPQGAGYQIRMNQVLRRYVKSQKK